MSGARVELSAVDVDFDTNRVLSDVNLTIDAAEIIGLLGASGSGKSTMLRVIAGIVTQTRGTVTLDGRDVTHLATHRRNVGMVFQDNQLFPHRTTRENVAFGLKMHGVDARSRAARSDDWLERVGLAGFGDRRVTELSGGEAKRVALARTMITEPSVILLDEPLTGLDRQLHDQLAVELGALLRENNSTAVLVTHDLEEAANVADRVVRIDELNGPT